MKDDLKRLKKSFSVWRQDAPSFETSSPVYSGPLMVPEFCLRFDLIAMGIRRGIYGREMALEVTRYLEKLISVWREDSLRF